MAGRVTLDDFRVFAKRVRRERERLVGRFRHDTLRLVARTPPALGLAGVRNLRVSVREQAERAAKKLQAQRTRLLSAVQQQLDHVADLIVTGLKATPHAEVEDLKRRIAQVENGLRALKEKLGKEDAA